MVRDFDELKSLGKEKVAGKIVLFNHAFDKQMAAQGRGGEAYGEAVVYRSDGPSAAARLGAVAALIRSVGGAAYRLPHTGLTNYAADAAENSGGAADGRRCGSDRGARSRRDRCECVSSSPRSNLPDAVSYNVIGDSKGSEHPEQVVIVSGHLDSWDLGTGAIDDGAGVAVAMQAANLVQATWPASAPHDPRHCLDE